MIYSKLELQEMQQNPDFTYKKLLSLQIVDVVAN